MEKSQVLCEDCYTAICTGDYSFLDYYYNSDEATEKMEIIEDYLENLGVCTVKTNSIDDFCSGKCACCGTKLTGKLYSVTFGIVE